MRRVTRHTCEDAPIPEEQETEGQRQLHSLLLQQLDTDADIDRCVAKRKCFAPAALYKPFGDQAAGVKSLAQFQALQDGEQELASLRELGLTEQEMVLWRSRNQPEAGGKQRGGVHAAPGARQQRLQAIREKVEARERLLSLPQRLSASRSLSRREMEIERALFQGSERVGFLSALYHQEEVSHTAGESSSSSDHMDLLFREVLRDEQQAASGLSAESQGKSPSASQPQPERPCHRKQSPDTLPHPIPTDTLPDPIPTDTLTRPCADPIPTDTLTQPCTDPIPTDTLTQPCPDPIPTDTLTRPCADPIPTDTLTRPCADPIPTDTLTQPCAVTDPGDYQSKGPFSGTWTTAGHTLQQAKSAGAPLARHRKISVSQPIGSLDSVARRGCGGPLTVSGAVEHIPEEQIRENKETEEAIRSLPRFQNYERGDPSKVLCVKNLSPRASLAQLVTLFSRFQPPHGPPLLYRLLTGRLKGQAFITFSDAETAEAALDLLNGYRLLDKPLVIEFGRGRRGEEKERARDEEKEREG